MMVKNSSNILRKKSTAGLEEANHQKEDEKSPLKKKESQEKDENGDEVYHF